MIVRLRVRVVDVATDRLVCEGMTETLWPDLAEGQGDEPIERARDLARAAIREL